MALVTLDQVSISFGTLPLLDRIGLQIEAQERVCLIGRNGTGKSTLLQIINGELAPDSGSVWRQPGVRWRGWSRTRPIRRSAGVRSCGGRARRSERPGDTYHRTAVEVAENSSPALLEKLGSLQHELEERDGWRLEQRVEYFGAVRPPAEAIVDTLSGGWRRRVLLARALVAQPRSSARRADQPTRPGRH